MTPALRRLVDGVVAQMREIRATTPATPPPHSPPRPHPGP
jgi:hypothetical protein